MIFRPADAQAAEVNAMRIPRPVPDIRVARRTVCHLLVLCVLLGAAASPPSGGKTLTTATTSTTASVPTTATIAATRTPKPLLAVLDFTSEDVPSNELDVICQTLWERLHQQGRVTLMLREATQNTLSQWGLDTRRPLTQPHGYGRIGRALGVDYVVFGHASRPDGFYALDVSVFSVRQGATVVTETRLFEKGLPQMLTEMDKVAQALLALRPPVPLTPTRTPIQVAAATPAIRLTPPEIQPTSPPVVQRTPVTPLVATPRLTPAPTPTPRPTPPKKATPRTTRPPKTTRTPKATPTPTPRPPEPTPTPRPPEPTPTPKPPEPTPTPKPPEPTPTPKPTATPTPKPPEPTPTPKPPEPTPTPKPAEATPKPVFTLPTPVLKSAELTPKATTTPLASKSTPTTPAKTPTPTPKPPAKTPTPTPADVKAEAREPIMRAKELYEQAKKIGEREPEGLKRLVAAVELDPENLQYRYKLARAYFYNEDYKNTEKQCLEILKRDERHSDALTVLGSAYFHLEDYPKAIEAHEKALKIKPDNFYAQFNLAYVLIYVDKARARTELQKYLDMAGKEPSQAEFVKRAKQYLKQLE